MAQFPVLTAADAETALTAEAVVWLAIGVVFVGGGVWAIVARVRRERKEEKYEDRNN